MQDNILYDAVYTKVRLGEPLTIEEAQRWKQIITTPFNISSPSTEQGQQLLYEVRQTLKQVYDIK